MARFSGCHKIFSDNIPVQRNVSSFCLDDLHSFQTFSRSRGSSLLAASGKAGQHKNSAKDAS
jgi:hypothetical protein